MKSRSQDPISASQSEKTIVELAVRVFWLVGLAAGPGPLVVRVFLLLGLAAGPGPDESY